MQVFCSKDIYLLIYLIFNFSWRLYKNQIRTSANKICGQTAYFRNAKKLRATRYKSSAIIEAKKNILETFSWIFRIL